MLYFKVGAFFAGCLLITFPGVRIIWQFVRWAVTTLAETNPPFVGEDPRIEWKVEAFAMCVGFTLLFVAWRV